MILFLDTSVVLAACGSPTGASREIFLLARANLWSLVTSEYVADEVVRNLAKFAPAAAVEWELIKASMIFRKDVLAFDLPVVFQPSKDRPVLFTAATWADILLTLDDADFGVFYGNPFYGLEVLEPVRS